MLRRDHLQPGINLNPISFPTTDLTLKVHHTETALDELFTHALMLHSSVLSCEAGIMMIQMFKFKIYHKEWLVCVLRSKADKLMEKTLKSMVLTNVLGSFKY